MSSKKFTSLLLSSILLMSFSLNTRAIEFEKKERNYSKNQRSSKSLGTGAKIAIATGAVAAVGVTGAVILKLLKVGPFSEPPVDNTNKHTAEEIEQKLDGLQQELESAKTSEEKIAILEKTSAYIDEQTKNMEHTNPKSVTEEQKQQDEALKASLQELKEEINDQKKAIKNTPENQDLNIPSIDAKNSNRDVSKKDISSTSSISDQEFRKIVKENKYYGFPMFPGFNFSLSIRIDEKRVVGRERPTDSVNHKAEPKVHFQQERYIVHLAPEIVTTRGRNFDIDGCSVRPWNRNEELISLAENAMRIVIADENGLVAGWIDVRDHSTIDDLKRFLSTLKLFRNDNETVFSILFPQSEHHIPYTKNPNNQDSYVVNVRDANGKITTYVNYISQVSTYNVDELTVVKLYYPGKAAKLKELQEQTETKPQPEKTSEPKPEESISKKSQPEQKKEINKKEIVKEENKSEQKEPKSQSSSDKSQQSVKSEKSSAKEQNKKPIVESKDSSKNSLKDVKESQPSAIQSQNQKSVIVSTDIKKSTKNSSVARKSDNESIKQNQSNQVDVASNKSSKN